MLYDFLFRQKWIFPFSLIFGNLDAMRATPLKPVKLKQCFMNSLMSYIKYIC